MVILVSCRLSDGTVSCQISTQKCARLVAEPSIDTFVATQYLSGLTADDIEFIVSRVRVTGSYDLGCVSEWVRGEAGLSCDQVCGSQGKVCDSEQQSSLDRFEKVALAFQQANYTCKSFAKSDGYTPCPLSTNIEGKDCYIIVETKSECHVKPRPTYNRLCYCKVPL